MLGEVIDERLRLRVLQHPSHVFVEHRIRVEIAPLGTRQQRVIGQAAPEKIREPRSQFVLVESMFVGGVVRVFVGLNPKQEVRRDENRRHRDAHSERERFAALHRVIDQFDEARQLDFADRSAKGASQERPQILACGRRDALVATGDHRHQSLVRLRQCIRIELDRPDQLHVAHDQIAIPPILVLRFLIVEIVEERDRQSMLPLRDGDPELARLRLRLGHRDAELLDRLAVQAVFHQSVIRTGRCLRRLRLENISRRTRRIDFQ